MTDPDPTGADLTLEAFHSVSLTIPQWEAGVGPKMQSAAVLRAATDKILPAVPTPKDPGPRAEWAIRQEIRAQYLAMAGVLEAMK